MLARIRDVTFKQSTSSTKILQFTVSIWKLEYKGVLELQLFLKINLFSHSEGKRTDELRAGDDKSNNTFHPLACFKHSRSSYTTLNNKNTIKDKNN